MENIEFYKGSEKTLGNIIRKARLACNISINELSYRTKINKSLLLHLENDRYDKLPNKVYVAGFLKLLAEIIKFDLSEAQVLLAQEKEKMKSDCHWNRLKLLSLSLPLFYKRPLGLTKKILIACASSLTLSIVFIVMFMSSGLRRVESVTSTKIVLKDHSPASKEIPLILKPISLTIEALNGDSWVAYKTNSNKIVTLTLKKGKNLNLKANSIRLILGNYKALKVIKNGEEYNYTGKLNKNVANVIFPENLKEKFETPYITFNKDETTVTNERTSI